MAEQQPTFWSTVQGMPWAGIGQWLSNVGGAALAGWLATGTWQGAAVAAAAAALGLYQTPPLRLPGMAPAPKP